MNDDWVRRYVALLGLKRDVLSLEALNALTRAHRRVVFENVTSLLRKRANPAGPMPPLDLELILSSWEEGRAGGVCYEVGEMLTRLLPALGYAARPVLAEIGFPGSHQAVIVELDGREYLVDAGNGAPFLEAFPLDEPAEVRRAGLSYRFRRHEEAGRLVQDRAIRGEWTPFCYYDLRAALPEEREASYQGHHVLPGRSFVMTTLRMVRCDEDEVHQLLDHELTRYTPDGKESQEVYGVARYREVIADVFGLPALPVEAGLEAWSSITGAKV
jgi:arylamine N-acetyltransferase